MKSFILFIFLSVIFFTTDIKSQVIVGALVGVSNNSISGDAPEDVVYGGKLGFTFGLNGELRIGNGINLFIQPRYHQRGIKISYDVGEDDPVDSSNADINYFSLPVGLKIYSGNRVVFFSGGFDFGYLLDAKSKTINPPETEKDISSLLKKSDVALFLGFGVNFNLGFPQLNLELRYTSGITNAYSGNGGNVFAIPARFRLTSFQLLAAINFPLSKKEERGVKK